MRQVVSIMVLALIFGCKQETKQKDVKDDMAMETTADDQQNDWTILFDGTSMDGWHEYLGEGVSDVWKLEDGAMVFYPPEERPDGKSYNIVTDAAYINFVLSLEWKISQAGNSGIFWGVFEDSKFGQPYETGPEIQVLDDLAHPDAKNGTTHQAGSLYDMVPPSQKVVKPVGEWNECILMIDHNNNQGSVELNGVEIVTFPVHGEAWDAMVAKSKFAGWEGFGKYQSGKIGLQDHGDIVAYRNIKIKEL